MTAVSRCRVLQVVAADADEGRNGQVRYDLMFSTGDAARVFSVDGQSGQIRTAAPVSELQGTSFILSIRATDQPAVSKLSRCRKTSAKFLANFLQSEEIHGLRCFISLS